MSTLKAVFSGALQGGFEPGGVKVMNQNTATGLTVLKTDIVYEGTLGVYQGRGCAGRARHESFCRLDEQWLIGINGRIQCIELGLREPDETTLSTVMFSERDVRKVCAALWTAHGRFNHRMTCPCLQGTQ